MFALCVIQIKPQMELLLNLPSDSLTKQVSSLSLSLSLSLSKCLFAEALTHVVVVAAVVGAQIRLTQDLMEMFITYQIPSDLMSYDDNPSASVTRSHKSQHSRLVVALITN